ncbi:MAG: pyridoxamine 5'-phosphate oxidase [Bacteroidia bacterium]
MHSGSQFIASLRQEYAQHSLSEDTVLEDPIDQFRVWFKEAVKADLSEPNVMTLGTCGADNQPSVRVVLLKGVEYNGFVFYTNYNSDKGRDLEQNPKAALNFLWLGLERQVRIEGTAEKLSAEESDAYFNSRPFGSKLGAWSSPQSQEITKQELIENEEKFIAKYSEDDHVPRPEHWGGYRVVPHSIEFWQGRPSRLHDRIIYKLIEPGIWKLSRLAP